MLYHAGGWLCHKHLLGALRCVCKSTSGLQPAGVSEPRQLLHMCECCYSCDCGAELVVLIGAAV